MKCDGRPNGCRNCERLQLECVSDEGSKSGRRSVPVPLRKIRTYRSCTGCRVSKTKCDGDRPKCSRCSARNLECQYDGGSAPRWARNLSKAPTTASAEDEINVSHESSLALEDSRSPSLMQSRETDDPRTSSGKSSARDTTQTSHLDPLIDLDDTELSIHSWYVFDFMSSSSRPWFELYSDADSRLVAPELPSRNRIRTVIDHYFANIHPLRCFAFVHRPSFTRQLDKGFEFDDEKALLHIICAQGAK